MTTLVMLPTFIGVGSLMQRFYIREQQSIAIHALLGVIAVSAIWVCISFFTGLSGFVEICTIALGLTAFFYYKNFQKLLHFVRSNRVVFLSCLLLIFFAGSFPPFILDHFGYYVPTIKWLTEIGMVKGISNLDLVLGQMSFWHVLQAGFSHFVDPFLRLNVVLLVVYVIYALERKTWLLLLFLPILFLFVQSPSPDLVGISLGLMLLNEFLSSSISSKVLFLVALFAFAVKPTMVWLPVVCLLYFLSDKKTGWKDLLGGGFIMLLFFLKNLWCFGFPFFPLQFFGFNLDWQPNPSILKLSSEMAIKKTYDMQFSYAEIRNFTIIEYVENWLFLSGIKSWINCSLILVLIYFVRLTLVSKSFILKVISLSILIKAVLVLYVSAQYRFFLDVFFVFVFLMLYQKLRRDMVFFMLVLSSVLFFTVFSSPVLLRNWIPSFKLGRFMTGFQSGQLLKPSVFEWKKFRTYQIGNLKFNVVEAYPFSFDVPLPAITPQYLLENYNSGVFPQQVSSNIKDGFVWKKVDSMQKMELKKILEAHKSVLVNLDNE